MVETKREEHLATYVAGLKFREGATERFHNLPDKAPLMLEREPDNIHDENAVKILDDDRTFSAPFHLGYVPKYLAIRISPMMMPDTGVVVHCSKMDSDASKNSIKIVIETGEEEMDKTTPTAEPPEEEAEETQ